MLAVSAAAQEPAAVPPPAPDQQLSMQLMKYDQAKVMGDLAGAVKGYEDALKQVRNTPSLKNREEEILQRLSGAYIAAQRFPEAVNISRRILALHEADCKPGAEWVERCADAQYGLGLALMHSGDFAGAAELLTASTANFGKVNMQGDESFRMTKLKQRGDAESMLAAALFRAGQKDKSLVMFRKAIATLKLVSGNEKLDPGIRGSARKSQSDAEGSLKLLEGK